jgi:hypothetical protein
MKLSTPSRAAAVVRPIFLLARRCSPVVAGRSRGQGGAPAASARTNDLDPDEDRRTVWRRWAWSDPVAKSRVWGCQPCRAASPPEGLESRAPLAAATPTTDLTAPVVRTLVRTAGRTGCQAATILRYAISACAHRSRSASRTAAGEEREDLPPYPRADRAPARSSSVRRLRATNDGRA